jgi:hypothetical protein
MRVRACWVDDQDITDTVTYLHTEPDGVTPEVIDLREDAAAQLVPAQPNRQDRS